MSWKFKPNWCIVANKDRTIQLNLQRFDAKRKGATLFKADSSHAPRLSQPRRVLDLIRKAANAVKARLQMPFSKHLRQRKVHRPCFSEPERSLSEAKGEVPFHASAEFVRAYGAIVDALTATIINAEVGLNWLSAQSPDLEEVRRSLNTIANDGKRAGEIVVQLRAPMKRSSTANDAVDSLS